MLIGDFIMFLSTLLFYLTCLTLGSTLVMIDNLFRTRLYERLLRFFESFGR